MNYNFLKYWSTIVLLCFALFSQGQKDDYHYPKITDKSLKKGIELVEDYQYDEALTYLGKAESRFENDKDYVRMCHAKLYIAKCHVHKYDFQKARSIYSEIIRIGRETRNQRIEVTGMNAESVLCQYYSEFEQVKAYSLRILNMDRDSIHYSYISDSHTLLGEYYSYALNPDSTIYHYKKAIYIDSLYKDSNSISFNYMGVGAAASSLGDNELCLQMFEKGVSNLRPGKDDFKMADFYRRMSSVFIAELNFKKAKEYAQLSISISEEKSMPLNAAESYDLMATILMEEDQYEEAFEYLSKAKTIIKEKNKLRSLVSNASLISEYYLQKGLYENAKEELDVVEDITEEFDQYSSLINYDLARTRYYLAMNNVANAEKSLSRILNFKDLDNSPYNLLKAKQAQYSVEKLKGNYIDAISHLEEANDLRKKINMKTQAYIVHEMESKYDKAKKEKQIDDLAAQNKLDAIKLNQRNNLLIISAAIILLIVVVLLYITKQNKVIKKMMSELKVKNALITKTLGEKELLLKEIHHRVKNNLQVVSSLLSLQSRDIKDEFALEAISESRNRVKSMAIIHQNLYQEDNLMGINTKEYINKLSRSLFNSYKIDHDQLELESEVDEINLDVDTTIPLGLILNELLTNALKYAFPNGMSGKILVQLKRVEDELHLIVKDNGVGMDKNSDKTDSFGLKMIQTFAKKLEAEWEVENDNGTTISLKIKKFKLAV